MPIVLSGSYTRYLNGSYASSSYIAKNTQTKQMGYDALNLRHGNFTRNSSGSALLGSTSSVGWADPNQRRLEDRGTGTFALLEGQRINILGYSRDMTGISWALGSSATTIANVTSSPDDTTSGDRSIVSSSGFARYQGALSLINNGTYIMSFWARHPVSSGLAQYGIQDNTLQGQDFKSTTITINWARLNNRRKLTQGGSAYYVPGDGRAAGSIAASALDFISDLHQLELGTFPSSVVTTTTTVVTRSADELTFNAADVPDYLRNGSFEFDVYPYFSNTDITESLVNSGAQQTFTLLSFGSNDFLAITGSKFCMSASANFISGIFTASMPAWNRYQKITFGVDAAQGVVQVSTLTQSNKYFLYTGPWSWTSTGLRVGAISGSGDYPFFGQMSNFRIAPSITSALDTFQGGNFSRNSSGSFLTAAPTDGSTSFMRWANPNERRIENRGDGSDSMLLLEGARTNAIAYSEDFSNAMWTLDAGSSRTVVGGDPDGGSVAYRLTCSSGKFTVGETAGSLWSGYVATSLWVRATSGSSPHNTNTFRGVDGRVAQSGSVGTTWERYTEVLALSTSSQQTSLVPVDGRDWSAAGGVAAAAKDHRAWGAQRENNAFASSYIRASGSATARGADILSYPAGEYPTGFLTQGVRFTFAPIPNSIDFVTHATSVAFFTLLWFGSGSDYIAMTRSGTNAIISVVAGGVTKVSSNTLTWNANQKLTITANAVAGTLTIAGATTGDGTTTGTAWSWPNGTMYIGISSISTANAFGRYGRYIEVL